MFKAAALPLNLTAFAIALLALSPVLAIIYSSLELNTAQWATLWNLRIPELLYNTLFLSFLVAIFSMIFGVSAAWIVSRYHFHGKLFFIALLVLPLTVPSYALAYIYSTLTLPGGWLDSHVFSLLPEMLRPNLFTLPGAAFILSLGAYPYVFLLSLAALKHSHKPVEAAARVHGASALFTFWKIHLPMLRPAIAAGVAIVVLHTLSEFGAVGLLRIQTFTVSIYLQMTGRFDNHGAAALSLVLVLLSLVFLFIERYFRKRQQYYSKNISTPVQPHTLSLAKQVLVWAWLGIIGLIAFIIPLGWMIHWTLEAWKKQQIDQSFFEYALHSIELSAMGATLAIVLALPLIFLHYRLKNSYSLILVQCSSLGFSLPGPIIALGLIMLSLAFLPALYGTLMLLVLAMVIRFLPLSIQSIDSSMQKLTPAMQQAGRVLGAGSVDNFRRVVFPIIKGGLLTAWVLVFIDILKELPATLILRPVGYDTLPVRLWIEASEEMIELAAPAALLLVVSALPVIWILLRPKIE